MRLLLYFLCLTVCPGALQAQDQEGKLVDRLLRPDMTLANSAQDKKFSGTGANSVDRRFGVQSFYAGREPVTSAFADRKSAPARPFQTDRFTQATTGAEARANAERSFSGVEFRTRPSSLVRPSSSEGKVATTQTFTEGSRPFLIQGTRQKILDQQGKPLTIDEIRELLNKSK